MTPHTLDYRAAVRSVVLATDPATRPELAKRLAKLRPYVAAWEPDHEPPPGLAVLWAALCGAPKQTAHARKYLAGELTCTRDSQLAPPGWELEKARTGGRPRTRPEREPRPVGRPKGSKNRAKEAGDSATEKLSPDI